MPLTLRHLTYFVALAEERSFARAAARVHVTQPALSMQIREMEAALGGALAERLPRDLRLTPAGREVLGRARRILAEVQELEGLARAGALAGRLHIGVIPTVAPYLLPAVLPLVITMMSIEMGIAVIVEAIMSFVGLSVEPDVPAWGVMIADARQTMHQAPWGVVLPVGAIFLAVLAFNLLGDGLRRALDTRLVLGRAEAA